METGGADAEGHDNQAGRRGTDDYAVDMEKLAVRVSFWGGAVTMAVLKGVAYFACGSALMRTSMFESFGDVLSNAIIAVTQRQVNDPSNRRHYPLGKSRFAPLGVLFFCAFMCSAMSSIVFEAVQALATSEEDAPTGDVAEVALRRLFAARPKLEAAYGTGSAEDMIKQYGSPQDPEDESGSSTLMNRLLTVCTLVKLVLFFFCRSVYRLRGSEMVKALQTDHRNDAVSNVIVMFVTAVVARMSLEPEPWPYVSKIDPAASLLLALWILYGWGTTALEQLQLLSDRRAPEEHAEAIGEVAQQALKDAPLLVRGACVYHAGDGLRVRVDIEPAKGDHSAEAIGAALDALERGVRAANEDVVEVDTQLRSRSSMTRGAQDYSWVSEYASQTRSQ
eukprot:TRINITY_DN24122_c1_g1_i1.p1 TRINITY_DN24122_c1_g1~~TRINITY_DN24122_c1_g1_i1.p1  ORF type:complete len:414 (-),score=69.86 TRINITY_DN24122_c1_g1_i1:22-1197(-)